MGNFEPDIFELYESNLGLTTEAVTYEEQDFKQEVTKLALSEAPALLEFENMFSAYAQRMGSQEDLLYKNKSKAEKLDVKISAQCRSVIAQIKAIDVNLEARAKMSEETKVDPRVHMGRVKVLHDLQKSLDKVFDYYSQQEKLIKKERGKVASPLFTYRRHKKKMGFVVGIAEMLRQLRGFRHVG